MHQVWDDRGTRSVYEYDLKGRVLAVTQTIDDQRFVTRTKYNDVGEVERTIYPSGFTTVNHYNDRHLLTKVTDEDNTRIWELGADGLDARGNVLTEYLGEAEHITRFMTFTPEMGRSESINTVTGAGFGNQTLQFDMVAWDEVGNLDYRHDDLQNLREEAQYDDLNRLEKLTRVVNGQHQPQESMSYHANGNIKTKWNVQGEYEYGQSTCGRTAGPHAVTKAGGTTYCYNANGDMISTSDGRHVTWTPFGKPQRISKGSTSATFTYGPGRSRVKRVDDQNGEITTTYYGGSYEKVQLPSGVIEERHYIGGFAVYTQKSNETGLLKNYMLKDHLGSVTAYVNLDKLSTGEGLERSSFDAWGKRRQANWVDYSTEDWLTYRSKVSDRGYTGHEQIDSLGLIHMNGRVYDPLIGRFLSADPFVQDPGNLQSYNRYSYVWNNPLSSSDPSGFFSLKQELGNAWGWAKNNWGAFMPLTWLAEKATREFGRFARKNKYVGEITTIVGCAAAMAYTGPAGPGLCAGISASVTYGVTDGDFRASVKAGAIAYAQAYMAGVIGDTFQGATLFSAEGAGAIIAHGWLGAATAAASGGDPRAGFLAGAAGKGFGLGLQDAGIYSSTSILSKPGEESNIGHPNTC